MYTWTHIHTTILTHIIYIYIYIWYIYAHIYIFRYILQITYYIYIILHIHHIHIHIYVHTCHVASLPRLGTRKWPRRAGRPSAPQWPFSSGKRGVGKGRNGQGFRTLGFNGTWWDIMTSLWYIMIYYDINGDMNGDIFSLSKVGWNTMDHRKR